MLKLPIQVCVIEFEILKGPEKPFVIPVCPRRSPRWAKGSYHSYAAQSHLSSANSNRGHDLTSKVVTDPPGSLLPAHLQVETRAVQIKMKVDCLERRDKYVLTFLPSLTAGTEGSATAKSQDPEESTRACHSEGCSVALR